MFLLLFRPASLFALLFIVHIHLSVSLALIAMVRI